MRLCSRAAVFGAFLVINVCQANAPLMSAIPRISASAGPRTFTTSTWNNFQFAATPCSDACHAHGWLIRGFCTSKQRKQVGREEGYVALHHAAQVGPFVLLSTGLPKFCSSSSAVANVMLQGEDRDVSHEGQVPRESQHLYRSATMQKYVMSADRSWDVNCKCTAAVCVGLD